MSTSLAPPVRVACVGDSITYGHGIADRAAASYPAVLQTLLGAKYEVRNFGVSATTLLTKGDRPYRREPQFRAAVGFDPNVLVVALGTNDTKSHNWRHVGDLTADLTAFAEAFRTRPGKPVVYVCLPPPAFGDPFDIAEGRLREVRLKLAAAAKGLKLTTIDLNAPLAGRAALVPDGVHPNAAGAVAIAEAVAAVIR